MNKRCATCPTTACTLPRDAKMMKLTPSHEKKNIPGMRASLLFWTGLGLMCCGVGCSQRRPSPVAGDVDSTARTAAEVAKASPKHPTTNPVGPELVVADLHNVHALTPRLFAGSEPRTAAQFAALRKLGIKTIISVDGSRPAADLAEKFGFRYVHLPFGYDGVPRDRELEIGRAVRDLPGPFYIHCHHGQHRGPTGAVIAAMTCGGWTANEAVAALQVFGTSPHYSGLYESARDFKKPTPEELDGADASFPRIAKLDDLADVMVQIDHRWDHLKEARKANWSVPPDHPDIDPPPEALQLKELFREAHRPGGPAAKRPQDLQERLGKIEEQSTALETALRGGDKAVAFTAAAAIDQSCTQCHARYRDPALSTKKTEAIAR